MDEQHAGDNEMGNGWKKTNAKQSTQTIIANPSMNINQKTTDRQAYEQLRNSYSTVQRWYITA